MVKHKVLGRDFEIHYKDGTSNTFSTSQLVYYYDSKTLAYVEFYSQHLSDVMRNKTPLLLLKKKDKNENQNTPIPNDLETIIDTSFIKKINILGNW